MGNFRNKSSSASPNILGVLFLQVLITSLGGSYGELAGKVDGWAAKNPQESFAGLHSPFLASSSPPLTFDFRRREKRSATSQLTTQNLQSELERSRKLLKDELLSAFSEKFVQIQGLKKKLKTLRSQVNVHKRQIEMKDAVIDRQDNDIKRLQDIIDSSSENKDKDDELAWLKNSFLKNPEWDTELHLAVSRQDENAVKGLLNNGTYINPTNKKLETPLFKASYNYIPNTIRIRMIMLLINSGANSYLKDNRNTTFLHNLVAGGTSITPNQFHEISEFVISKNLASLFNEPGWSWSSRSTSNPFQSAVKNIEVESRTLSLLHKNGVNFNVVSQNEGHSVLADAVHGKRSTRLLSDLSGFGVSWKSLDKYNRSLLHHAASAGYVEGVTYCLGLGLNVNGLDSWGDTPLHLTMLHGTDNVLGTARLLVENGTDLKLKNNAGRSPLDVALRRNDLPDKEKVVKLLKDSA